MGLYTAADQAAPTTQQPRIVGPTLVEPAFQEGKAVIELHRDGETGLAQVRVADAFLHIRHWFPDGENLAFGQPQKYAWGEWRRCGLDRFAPADFMLACQLVAIEDMNLEPQLRQVLVQASAKWQWAGGSTWRLCLNRDSDILVWRPGLRWTWEYRVGKAVLLHASHTRDTDEMAKDEAVVEVRKLLRDLARKLPGSA